MTESTKRVLHIVNEKGLHARASAKLVEVVEAHDAQAEVSRDGQSASGDSIMGLLMLAASKGTSIEIETRGPEAEKLNAATIGIRPEHIAISESDGMWEGTVGVSEHLGSDTFFRVKCPAFPEHLTVRASGEVSLSYGAKVFLTPDSAHLHRFDGAGLRIA